MSSNKGVATMCERCRANQDEGLTDEERKMVDASIERNREIHERLAKL